ncbi:hypothetical protein L596_027930 [Steinernema carpocapsae]|nr:hypothetical protein L596_027930 [Steinernema carpocapsae]
MLVLTWMSDPINDLYSDAIVTAIFHAQTNPVPDKYLPRKILPDSRLKLVEGSLRRKRGDYGRWRGGPREDDRRP